MLKPTATSSSSHCIQQFNQFIGKHGFLEYFLIGTQAVILTSKHLLVLPTPFRFFQRLSLATSPTPLLLLFLFLLLLFLFHFLNGVILACLNYLLSTVLPPFLAELLLHHFFNCFVSGDVFLAPLFDDL